MPKTIAKTDAATLKQLQAAAKTGMPPVANLKTLPKKLTINQTQILITNSLQTSDIIINENANLTLVALLKKGFHEPQKINFHLKGENSQVTFLGLIIGRNDEKFHFETISNHTVPNTNAYYYIRAAMFDRSEIDYKGNLIIKPKAQITDCYLAHHTLMLSRDAKTNSIPSLEIEADDVKAGHAATIGKVDDDMIFYFQSRGIDKKQAQEMLIQGFLENDLKKIPNEEAQKTLTQAIADLLRTTNAQS